METTERELVRTEPPEAVDEAAALSEIACLAAELAAAKAAEWAAPQDDRIALSRSLIAQEDEIRKTEPEFALQELMEASAAFRALVMAGERVAKALEYVQPERAQKRLEEEVLLRIRKRNLRPQGIGEQNKAPEPATEERLSESEMRRIDAQLKRGQKVYLR